MAHIFHESDSNSALECLKFSSGLFMCQINEILWTFKLADKKCSTLHISRKIAKILKTAFYPKHYNWPKYVMNQTLLFFKYLLVVPVNGLKFSSGLFMCQINEILWTFKLADKKCSTYKHILRKIASVRAIETLHLPIDKNQTSTISQGTLT